MTAREIGEWVAFQRVTGPIDVRERVDMGFALIAERITNSLTTGKGKRLTSADFMPDWGAAPRVEWEEDGGEEPA